MEAVGDLFSRSIQHTIEEEGILAYEDGSSKYAAVYNMHQTAIYIGVNGKTTMEFVGAPTVDVLQGSAVNRFLATVLLAASATGHKLIPFVVFAGVPGARVAVEVWDPAFGANNVEHTVQRKAYCDEHVMVDCIERVWKPSITGCRDSAVPRFIFIPPGITGIKQPMGVAVMKAFKDRVRSYYLEYLEYHIDNDFPKSPKEKRDLISRIVAAAWYSIPEDVIVKGFVKAGIIPRGRYRVPSIDSVEAPVLCDEE